MLIYQRNLKKKIFKRAEAVAKLEEEVIDRYGQLPKNVKLLFEKKLLELFLSSKLVDNYREHNLGLDITLTMGMSNMIDGLKLFEVMSQINRSIKIKYVNNKISLTLPKSATMIDQAIHILNIIDSGRVSKEN